jgi:hypothetical protein
VTASIHARGIVIAGALAALALALGFVTLGMNQTASQAAAPAITPLKDRHHSAGTAKTSVAKKRLAAKSATAKAATAKAAMKVAAKPKQKVAIKRPNPNLVAALKAGLPRSVAEGLAKRPVVVVELWSRNDPVGLLSAGEAQAGAALAGAAFVGVNVDQDGGAISVLTRALGKIPVAPAALVYTRPATLSITLTGFNDRTAIQQAVASAPTIQPSAGTIQSGGTTTPTTSSSSSD